MIEIKKNGLLKYKDFACKCSFGKSGIKSKKIEGDNATPKGIFSLGKIYYRNDRIKNIQSKLAKKKITKGMRDGAKQKLIGDLQKLVDGDRPDWWPKSFKLNRKQITALEKQLNKL